jgi:hypothetical protein
MGLPALRVVHQIGFRRSLAIAFHKHKIVCENLSHRFGVILLNGLLVFCIKIGESLSIFDYRRLDGC